MNWSRDSTRLTAASEDRLLRQWNAETGDPLWAAVELPQGEAATFSPGGQLIYETPRGGEGAGLGGRKRQRDNRHPHSRRSLATAPVSIPAMMR